MANSIRCMGSSLVFSCLLMPTSVHSLNPDFVGTLPCNVGHTSCAGLHPAAFMHLSLLRTCCKTLSQSHLVTCSLLWANQ